ncbi:MAG: invasion associated locus B family protein [Parvibaculum sp.]
MKMIYRMLPALVMALVLTAAPQIARAETVTAEDGTTYEKFNNWIGRCQPGPNETKVCSVSVEIRTQESQSLALFFGIGKEPGKGYYLLNIVPLGTVLPAGVKLSIDGNELATLQLQVCLPRGCQSLSGVTPEGVGKLKSGNEMVVGISDIQQGPVSLNVSLAGMTAAIGWLDTQYP